MFSYLKHQKEKLFFSFMARLTVFILSLSLIFSPTASYAQSVNFLNLPIPGTMIAPSPTFVPVLLKGMTIHPDDPLKFDFIVDSGNTNFTTDQVKEESQKLVKYFLASMTVPKDDLWVNLSPYEKDRVIPEELGKTELGRDMLAQDYILKQLTASLVYPEEELGKKFWDKIYQKAEEQFGTSEIPVNTFNKVWILPETAKIYVHEQTVYVVDAHLKVMLDSDYEAMQHLQNSGDVDLRPVQDDSLELSEQIIREIIVPEIEKEVNEGQHFAPLRQIYHSLILAKWYKETIKNSLLSQVYADKNMIDGVESKEKDVKNQIYAQYMEAYKKGVFNYIKEDHDRLSQEIIPRKYFSGGEWFSNFLVEETSSPVIDTKTQKFRVKTQVIPQGGNDMSRRKLLGLITGAAIGAAILPLCNGCEPSDKYYVPTDWPTNNLSVAVADVGKEMIDRGLSIEVLPAEEIPSSTMGRSSEGQGYTYKFQIKNVGKNTIGINAITMVMFGDTKEPLSDLVMSFDTESLYSDNPNIITFPMRHESHLDAAKQIAILLERDGQEDSVFVFIKLDRLGSKFPIASNSKEINSISSPISLKTMSIGARIIIPILLFLVSLQQPVSAQTGTEQAMLYKNSWNSQPNTKQARLVFEDSSYIPLTDVQSKLLTNLEYRLNSSPQPIGVLIEALSDNDWTMRYMAIKFLTDKAKKKNINVVQAFYKVIGALSDVHSRVRNEAISFLLEFPNGASIIMNHFRKLLKDENNAVRIIAIKEIESRREIRPGNTILAINDLINIAKDPFDDRNVRHAAIIALRKIILRVGVDEAPQFFALRGTFLMLVANLGISDENGGVRSISMDSLSKLAHLLKEFIPKLAKQLESDNRQEQSIAITVSALLGSVSTHNVPRVLLIAKDVQNPNHLIAIGALGDTVVQNSFYVSMVLEFLNSVIEESKSEEDRKMAEKSRDKILSSSPITMKKSTVEIIESAENENRKVTANSPVELPKNLRLNTERLNNADPEIRWKAVWALTLSGDYRVIKHLEDMKILEKDPLISEDIEHALLTLKKQKMIEEHGITAFYSDNEDDRNDAFAALWAFGISDSRELFALEAQILLHHPKYAAKIVRKVVEDSSKFDSNDPNYSFSSPILNNSISGSLVYGSSFGNQSVLVEEALLGNSGLSLAYLELFNDGSERVDFVGKVDKNERVKKITSIFKDKKRPFSDRFNAARLIFELTHNGNKYPMVNIFDKTLREESVEFIMSAFRGELDEELSKEDQLGLAKYILSVRIIKVKLKERYIEFFPNVGRKEAKEFIKSTFKGEIPELDTKHNRYALAIYISNYKIESIDKFLTFDSDILIEARRYIKNNYREILTIMRDDTKSLSERIKSAQLVYGSTDETKNGHMIKVFDDPSRIEAENFMMKAFQGEKLSVENKIMLGKYILSARILYHYASKERISHFSSDNREKVAKFFYEALNGKVPELNSPEQKLMLALYIRDYQFQLKPHQKPKVFFPTFRSQAIAFINGQKTLKKEMNGVNGKDFSSWVEDSANDLLNGKQEVTSNKKKSFSSPVKIDKKDTKLLLKQLNKLMSEKDQEKFTFLGVKKIALARAVNSFPRLAKYDIESSLRKIQKALSVNRSTAAKYLVSHPPLAEYDIEGNIRELVKVLGITRNAAVRYIKSYRQLAGYNIEKKVDKIIVELNVERENIIEAIISHIALMGYSIEKNLKPKIVMIREAGVDPENELNVLITLAQLNINILGKIAKTFRDNVLGTIDIEEIINIYRKLDESMKDEFQKTASELLKEDKANMESVLMPWINHLLASAFWPFKLGSDDGGNRIQATSKNKAEPRLSEKTSEQLISELNQPISQKRLEIFTSQGINKSDVFDAVKKYGSLATTSDIQGKLDDLGLLLGTDRKGAAEAVIRYPQLIGASVEKSLKPKMAIIKEIGVERKNELGALINLTPHNVDVLRKIVSILKESGNEDISVQRIIKIYRQLDRSIKKQFSGKSTIKVLNEKEGNMESILVPKIEELIASDSSPGKFSSPIKKSERLSNEDEYAAQEFIKLVDLPNKKVMESLELLEEKFVVEGARVMLRVIIGIENDFQEFNESLEDKFVRNSMTDMFGNNFSGMLSHMQSFLKGEDIQLYKEGFEEYIEQFNNFKKIVDAGEFANMLSYRKYRFIGKIITFEDDGKFINMDKLPGKNLSSPIYSSDQKSGSTGLQDFIRAEGKRARPFIVGSIKEIIDTLMKNVNRLTDLKNKKKLGDIGEKDLEYSVDFIAKAALILSYLGNKNAESLANWVLVEEYDSAKKIAREALNNLGGSDSVGFNKDGTEQILADADRVEDKRREKLLLKKADYQTIERFFKKAVEARYNLNNPSDWQYENFSRFRSRQIILLEEIDLLGDKEYASLKLKEFLEFHLTLEREARGDFEISNFQDLIYETAETLIDIGEVPYAILKLTDFFEDLYSLREINTNFSDEFTSESEHESLHRIIFLLLKAKDPNAGVLLKQAWKRAVSTRAGVLRMQPWLFKSVAEFPIRGAEKHLKNLLKDLDKQNDINARLVARVLTRLGEREGVNYLISQLVKPFNTKTLSNVVRNRFIVAEILVESLDLDVSKEKHFSSPVSSNSELYSEYLTSSSLQSRGKKEKLSQDFVSRMADYIETVLREENSRIQLPDLRELAIVFKTDRPKISRKYKKVILELESRVSKEGYDEELKSRIKRAIKWKVNFSGLLADDIEMLFKMEMNRTQMPTQMELAILMGRTQDRIAVYLPGAITDLRKRITKEGYDSELRVRVKVALDERRVHRKLNFSNAVKYITKLLEDGGDFPQLPDQAEIAKELDVSPSTLSRHYQAVLTVVEGNIMKSNYEENRKKRMLWAIADKMKFPSKLSKASSPVEDYKIEIMDSEFSLVPSRIDEEGMVATNIFLELMNILGERNEEEGFQEIIQKLEKLNFDLPFWEFGQFVLVIRELLANVMMHTDNPRVNVKAGIDGAGQFVFIVRDYGLGFTDPDKKKIFRKFYTTRKLNREESGVGLYYSQTFVRNVIGEGANIYAYDNQEDLGLSDSGATFKVVIPLSSSPVGKVSDKLGGIDMNEITVDRQGGGVDFQFDPIQLQEMIDMGITGFAPVIINITPLPSVLPLLGLAPKEDEYELSSLN